MSPEIASPAKTLRIEKLVYGGEGLGRLPSGEVVFVPWSAPGDQVQVTCPPQQKKPLRASLQAVLEPGPERVAPPCSVFGECGGCQWQHLQPAAQREWKRRIVVESLERLGKLQGVQVLPTLGSDETAWHYRNRVQWEIGQAGQEYCLGYYKAASQEVVAFAHCWIIPEHLNRIAYALQERLKQEPALGEDLQRVEAYTNQPGDVLLSFYGRQPERLQPVAEALMGQCPEIRGVVLMNRSDHKAPPVCLAGQSFLAEQVGGNTFQVTAGSFFQTNHRALEHILDLLDKWRVPDGESLVDLYAGVGVFAVHFKDKFRRIVAVESARQAVADARTNIALNSAPHIKLKAKDVSQALATLEGDFDVAIVDPPRAGCKPDVLAWLGEHVQKQILYVSCNPTTLARDLKTLVAQGWQIQVVQPMDMFPQTYHIETVVALVRSET